jgi:DNA repair exonuclease SbcCD ATPase subunit
MQQFCRADLRDLLTSELERTQELLKQEAESRQRVNQESAATKEAVEEAIKDLEALDAERTELRTHLRV